MFIRVEISGCRGSLTITMELYIVRLFRMILHSYTKELKHYYFGEIDTLPNN